MAGSSFTSNMYRLRCASPMPAGGGLVLHTFGTEVLILTTYMCTPTIPSSNEFRGQGGSLMSASFSRLNVSQELYQGRTIRDPGEGANWIG